MRDSIRLAPKGASDVLHKPVAKTARGKRILLAREPQLREGPKQAVFAKGTTTSAMGCDALQALYALKKPLAVMLGKRNELHPFEHGKNDLAVEFLMQRNDAPILCLHTHSKKRPHTLTFVRTYDRHLYDMYELHVERFLGLQGVGARSSDAWTVGEKPAMVFSGEAFAMDDGLQELKLLLLDFFRGVQVESLDITGLHTVLHFTAVQDESGKPCRLLMRAYRLELSNSVPAGDGGDRFALSPLGPFIDFRVGRMQLPPEDIKRHAHRIARALKPKKVKNISTNALGQKFGRVHVGRQEIGKLQTRKVKALRKRPAASKNK